MIIAKRFFPLFLFISLIVFSPALKSQNSIDRIEPPFWWQGMESNELQLLVHGEDIGALNILISSPLVKLETIHRPENQNYLFLDLLILNDSSTLVEGKNQSFDIIFEYQRSVVFTYTYDLKARKPGSAQRQGFDPSDAIYLLMPDRFANGNEENDSSPNLMEQVERDNPDGRHGGDIQGIIDHLDYIDDLGFTAVWLNPVLENNMPNKSYHGYAITDFYKVDGRFGSNRDYLEMIEACHEREIKVIMDMVFNHCGLYHWWIDDLPMENWIHQFPVFTRSNYRGETTMDPYAVESDKSKMLTGWFDATMPDMNQHNLFLANYLIQNSIWWIEYADLDGIRMDTYPYSYQDFMERWVHRLMQEYPNFNIVGETWLQKESHTSWFLGDSAQRFGYDSELPTVTDFPLHYAMEKAFIEDDSWTEGLFRLYYVLSQDYLYSDAMNTLTFPDNHDLNRFYTAVGEDLEAWKMAMTFLLTTRGTPMIYYGTELLMTGWEHDGHGHIRADFPGGWSNDPTNAFTAEGRTDDMNDAVDYLSRLLNWRQGQSAIHSGEMKHYLPQNGLYVYFRYDDDNCVMVAINNAKEDTQLKPLNYTEGIRNYQHAEDVFSSEILMLNEPLLIPAHSARVFNLKN